MNRSGGRVQTPELIMMRIWQKVFNTHHFDHQTASNHGNSKSDHMLSKIVDND
ncbi:hypothetical protein D9C73_023871 [Collichthys lucidus]|uniref:Uncharacterized protein n=1 Tax=Collichthys lucidus TaxID=240159 RepID=A0A4U5VMS3_COLLU|nr:hypothetical protein D9C73_023871 [Collichthys lucidus]